MRATIPRYAASAAVLALLALATASGSFEQASSQATIRTAQYCAPQDETPDAHRFYCRN